MSFNSLSKKNFFRWQPYYLLYLINIVIAVALTFLSFRILPIPLTRHKISRHIENASLEFIDFYHDFNRDGFSEKIRLKHQTALNQYAVKVYTFYNKLIDQWNFREPWVRGIIYGDYNKDHHDEAYFLTHTNDSLFIYGLDIRNKKFFLYRKFIVAAPRPNPNPNGEWDLEAFHGFLTDTDNDGFDEVIFIINAGFSLQPRGVFAFSVQKQRLIAQSPPSGAKLSVIIPYDFNNDGAPEFLVGSSTSENYHKPFPYSDRFSWVFLYDRNLNFVFPPIKFFPGYSGSKPYPIQFGKKIYIVSDNSYFGKLDLNPTIALIDLKGNIIRELKLPKDVFWRLLPLPVGDYTELYLTNERGELFRLNEELKKEKILEIEYPFGSLLASYDLDGDLQPEYIFASDNVYLIMETNFSEYCASQITDISCITPLQFRKRGNRPPEMILNYPKYTIHIEYYENPLYHLAHFIIGGTFLFYFFILQTITLLSRNHFFLKRFTRQLLDHSPNGILILNHKGRIYRINAQIEQLLNLTSHIREETNFQEELSERPEIVTFINRIIKENKPNQSQLHFIAGNYEFEGTILGMPLTILLNIPIGYYIEISDDRFQVQPDRIRLWSKTVQKMAHDIKTPLSTVQLSLRTLEMKLRDQIQDFDKNFARDFELVDSELKKVREMTRNFLKFTNLEHPNLQLCSLTEIIRRTLNHFKNYFDGKISIQLELDPEYDRVWADPQQLEMVFQIVLENAIDAMEGEGRILISSNLAQYLDRKLKSYVEIEIADTGPGIPESELEKVFDPYYTTKREGTGMGLTIARKIIEDHQGEITIVSRKDFGTVVRIILPVGNVGENDYA